MAFYVDEDEVYKCSKHPSKRRRSGICPVCLRDKLASLCPDCAHDRPCACSATSCSSSFYRYSTTAAAAEDASSVGSIGGGISNLTEREPTFRRSKSFVIPFLRSKHERLSEKDDLAGNKSKTPSFWSMFKASNRSKRRECEDRQRGEKARIAAEEERMRRMTKSRSVLVTSHPGIIESNLSPSTKAKSWYFPSPMKVFRQSRGLVFQERSPLYRW